MSGVLLAVLLSAQPAAAAETITWHIDSVPFCLACVSYTVTLDSDGSGQVFVLTKTAVRPQRFRATRNQATAFRARLARWRPDGERHLDQSPPCGPLATDQDTVDVRWSRGGRTTSHLVLYGGCDMNVRAAMIRDVFGAPSLLPIANLIAHR